MGGTKKLIGIFGVRIYEQNIMPFLQVLKQRGEENGFRLISFSGSTNSQEETDEIIGQYQLVELIRQTELCALVILTETILNETMIQKLLELGREKNIPVFSLDRHVDGCYSMLMDNEDCFEQIVRHVVEEHGCRRVNMIGGDKGHSFSEERIAIYRRILEENGIPYEEERVGYGNWWERPVAEVVKRFFESDLPFPEAIVCANDIMAHAAVTTLNEYGMEVPEDIIVTGYDGTKDGLYFFPSMTTGAPDFEQMVQWLFERIYKCHEDGEIKPCDVVVPVLMKKRQSCGCEPKMIPGKDRRIAKLLAEIGNGKWHMKGMHLMLIDSFGKQNIEEVQPIIQKHMDVFFDYYQYACVKSELFDTYEVSEEFSKMKSILDANRGNYREAGKNFHMSDFQVYIDNVFEKENVNTILVHLLNSGKIVYGFSVEGFEELIDWKIKHCDEFAMFVSHILHSVVHNHKMNELNQTLHNVNKEIEEMSYRDSMTGRYNRRGFFHEMRKILRNQENEGKYLDLFMIDMDGLKHINDTFGHSEGDFAIVTLANVLPDLGRGQAVCSRVGGDEFICAYVSEEQGNYNLEDYRKQLECSLKKAADVAGKSYDISASVGMISEKITADLELDVMINSADDRMYEHKIKKRVKRS